MKTLVLCVDRDDDLGIKASINGPVIGRDENLKAMLALGLSDPEDVDTNTILAGLQLYDDLVKRGMEAEMATISGDANVGFQSDLIIANQLENVLEVVKPDRAILVSDGAEDESIYPVISSRIKIDSVKRVYVKQSPSIEGTYYTVVKTLQNEKMRKWFVLPSLALIIFGALSLYVKMVAFSDSDYEEIGLISQMAFGVMGVVLGLYLIGWAYRWGDWVRVRAAGTRRAIKQGSLVIPFALVSFVLVVVGILIGYDMVMAYREKLFPDERSLAISILQFISGVVWFVAFAVFAYETGKSVTTFLQTGKVRWSYIVMMVSVLATGFIVMGSVDALLYFLSYGDMGLEVILAEMITGILIAIFSSVLNASLRKEAAQAAPAQGA